MSALSTLRSLAFLSVIVCGLAAAAWNSGKDVAWFHDQHRGDVVWIDTGRR
jgi:hypothetical protein